MGAGVPNTLSFTLDGGSQALVGEPVLTEPGQIVPHYMIYNSIDLSDGPHTLVSTIAQSGHTPGLGSAYMIIDYFVVTRPSNADVSGLTLLYDDMHPAFEYSGQWNVLQGQTDAFLNMNWTLHGAVSPGATATFNFTGTLFFYYRHTQSDRCAVLFRLVY